MAAHVRLRLDQLHGDWHVRATSFPMWLDGKRQRPAIRYAPGKQSGHDGLIDIVRYDQAGRSRVIRGFDRPLDEANSRFVWRGSGWLFPFVSRWTIRDFDEAGGWMFITFDRTLFTPAGCDLLVRDPAMNEDAVRGRLAAIATRLPDISAFGTPSILPG